MIAGPWPCPDCHARLWWDGKRWLERVAPSSLVAGGYTYRPHRCTGRDRVDLDIVEKSNAALAAKWGMAA